MKYILWIIALVIMVIAGSAVLSLVGGAVSLIIGSIGYIAVALVSGTVGRRIGRAQERKMLGRGL